MIMVSVIYPADSSVRFDMDYYLQTHIPLVKERWTPHGMTDVEVVRGIAKADGSAPDFRLMTLMTFTSLDAYKAAGAAHGREVSGDVANFTDKRGIVQINEIIA
jgi:uncharacterized protein (TIGR02118 family)